MLDEIRSAEIQAKWHARQGLQSTSVHQCIVLCLGVGIVHVVPTTVLRRPSSVVAYHWEFRRNVGKTLGRCAAVRDGYLT